MAMSQAAVKELAGTACQIAYEYPGWTDEHVGEMVDLCSKEITFGKLMQATQEAQKHVDAGLEYADAEKKVIGFCNQKWGTYVVPKDTVVVQYEDFERYAEPTKDEEWVTIDSCRVIRDMGVTLGTPRFAAMQTVVEAKLTVKEDYSIEVQKHAPDANVTIWLRWDAVVDLFLGEIEARREMASEEPVRCPRLTPEERTAVHLHFGPKHPVLDLEALWTDDPGHTRVQVKSDTFTIPGHIVHVDVFTDGDMNTTVEDVMPHWC